MKLYQMVKEIADSIWNYYWKLLLGMFAKSGKVCKYLQYSQTFHMESPLKLVCEACMWSLYFWFRQKFCYIIYNVLWYMWISFYHQLSVKQRQRKYWKKQQSYLHVHNKENPTEFENLNLNATNIYCMCKHFVSI